MSYFDTSKRTMVIVDASPVGISAILAQREKDPQQYKVIAYCSDHVFNRIGSLQ